MFVDRYLRALVGAALLALVAGCGGPPPPTAAEIAARAATMAPRDRHLADLYERSCKACHAQPEAKAPLTGDRGAWKTRLAKGRPTLVQSVLTGLNGMPAGGQCFTCTPQDYDALIAFMADEGGR